ncbi:polymorphic toxin-type HINT domain-containing protein [Spirillospora sp. CA-294931]|uniref:polymorphic toxin-type HINT domain-containing protein n=1 Tax=Spirillospora sp. CA-294931 TaxID=3240042 RepID=UPI003D8B83EC
MGETPEDREYADAKRDYDQAERDAQGVEDEWANFDLLKEIAALGLDFLAGDIIKCIQEPSLGDCLWALVSIVPWGKIGKLLKSIPKVVKLIDRYLDLKRRLDKARKARKDAKDRLDRAVEACKKKKPNSFVPGTPVLMGDGSRKAIERVRVGDRVWAADPVTGRSGPRAVTDLISGAGRKRLVDLRIDLDGWLGGRTSGLTATADHPFWLPGAGDWIDAGDLVPGDELVTAGGRTAVVVAAREYTRVQRVHNLTVSGLHTYYVGSGGRDLLVHNDPKDPEECKPDKPDETPTPSPTASKGTPDPASQAGDVDVVADKIAAHGDESGRGIPGVDDLDVAEHIEGIMRSRPGLKLRPTPGGTPRWAWWDPNTGTMIIREGDKGTFMQPDRGYDYFLEQLAE